MRWLQNRSGLYKRIYKENEKSLQHERHSIVESIVTTGGEEAGGFIDTNQLLAYCTGEDQVDIATCTNDALNESNQFTEICVKVVALASVGTWTLRILVPFK